MRFLLINVACVFSYNFYIYFQKINLRFDIKLKKDLSFDVTNVF